jgi:hypothetical protein
VHKFNDIRLNTIIVFGISAWIVSMSQECYSVHYVDSRLRNAHVTGRSSYNFRVRAHFNRFSLEAYTNHS